MKLFPKGLIFVASALTTAWLVSLAVATGAMPALHAQQPTSAQVAAATPATPLSINPFRLSSMTESTFVMLSGPFSAS